MKASPVLFMALFSVSTAACNAQAIMEGLLPRAGGFGMGAGTAYGVSKNVQSSHKLTPAQMAQANAQCAKAMAFAKDLEAKGKLKEACDSYKKTAAWREQTFGPKDSQVQQIYLKAAALYKKSGSLSDSEDCSKRALAACGRKNGPGSPEAIPILSNLVSTCQSLSKFKDADNYGTQALTLTERAYGADHLKTQEARQNLLNVLNAYSKNLRDTDNVEQAAQIEMRASSLRAPGAPEAAAPEETSAEPATKPATEPATPATEPAPEATNTSP